MTTRPGASPTGASRARRTGRETLPDRVVDFLDSIDTPLTTYYLLASVTAALTIVGLVMYLSASSIRSYDLFLRQLLFAGIGLVLCVIASRLPVRVWKRLAWPGILLSLALQALIFVPGLGQEFQGNRNWIQVAGVQLQPSEFAKIAIVVFGAAILDRKKDRLGQFWHAVIPLGPAAVLLLGLQLAGNDLGTGLVLLAIVAGMLFAAGVSARFFGFAALLGVGLASVGAQMTFTYALGYVTAAAGGVATQLTPAFSWVMGALLAWALSSALRLMRSLRRIPEVVRISREQGLPAA